MLASRTLGVGQKIAFVHGFTQTKDTWNQLFELLKNEFQLVSIDAPNHGESSDISLNLETGARAISEVVEDATYVGYSMGGRFCLTAAFAEPKKVRRLVLVSTTAGIENKQQRDERVAADEELAKRIEQIGVSQFIDEWLQTPIFCHLNSENSQRELRNQNSIVGLSTSLRLCGAGRQQPTWSKLKNLQMPVLVIAGAKDAKYLQLAQRIVQEIGTNASLQIIQNSGHTPHLEQPREFADTIRNFVLTTSDDQTET